MTQIKDLCSSTFICVLFTYLELEYRTAVPISKYNIDEIPLIPYNLTTS